MRGLARRRAAVRTPFAFRLLEAGGLELLRRRTGADLQLEPPSEELHDGLGVFSTKNKFVNTHNDYTTTIVLLFIIEVFQKTPEHGYMYCIAFVEQRIASLIVFVRAAHIHSQFLD